MRTPATGARHEKSRAERGFSQCICAKGRELVLHDLGDGAHRALFLAVATSDAGILFNDLSYAVNNLENLLRASFNADTTADALVCFDNWM